jgi:alpha-tubulin suppressor-like RCC1 family protein
MIKNESTIFSFGINNYAQLVDKTTINRAYPVQLQNENVDILDISGSNTHTLILQTGGILKSIGFNQVISFILIISMDNLGLEINLPDINLHLSQAWVKE